MAEPALVDAHDAALSTSIHERRSVDRAGVRIEQRRGSRTEHPTTLER